MVPNRNWALRGFRQSSCSRWPSITSDCFRSDQFHALLHCLRIRGIELFVPHCGVVQCIRYEIFRPCLGICDGLECKLSSLWVYYSMLVNINLQYALQWIVTLPLEIVAAAITIQYWNSPISSAVWVTIFLIVIISINLIGVNGYGEAEFWFSLVKVIAIIGFM